MKERTFTKGKRVWWLGLERNSMKPCVYVGRIVKLVPDRPADEPSWFVRHVFRPGEFVVIDRPESSLFTNEREAKTALRLDLWRRIDELITMVRTLDLM